MKIKEILQQPSRLPNLKKGDKAEGREVDFDRFLKDARAERSEGHKTASPSPPGPETENLSIPLWPVLSVNSLQEIKDVNPVRSQGFQVIENVLGVLERYQKALGDPRISLRQMDPLVRSLSEEVRSLNALVERVPSSDPLQKIMTDLGVVSTVEIEKFNRGEYT